MKDLKFTIENTGGVSHAELVLKPGVNVLKGRNGAGKTSCIDAVVRASGGKTPLQRKDGTEAGRVTGPGVVLAVRRVVKTDGHAELELADVGPLGRLIDPGLKDSKAAARERIRALVELLDIGVDDEKLLALCNGDRCLFADLTREVEGLAIDNLLEASEKLRHMAHARARDQEALAEAAGNEVERSLKECAEILETLGGAGGLSELTLAEANAELEAAIRNHDRALAKCEEREALEHRQGEIKKTLGARPDVMAAETGVASKTAAHAIARGKLETARDEVRRLELELKDAEFDLQIALTGLENAETGAAKWTEQTEVLGKKVEGPTREQLDTLKTEGLGAAREALRIANQTELFKAREDAHDRAVTTHKKAADKAQAFRDLAGQIPDKLGAMLAAAGAPGLTVYDGRLYVTGKEGGAAGSRDFEFRCSTGERVRAALAVAAHVYKGRVLALDGEVWGNLDPANRAEFAASAKEHDLCVVTEEPAEGPLRLELRPNLETHGQALTGGAPEYKGETGGGGDVDAALDSGKLPKLPPPRTGEA